MAKHFAQHFILGRNIGLAPHRVTELALDHHNGGFDIRSLVVMGQELFAVELKKVVHLLEESTHSTRGICLERDERHCPNFEL